ncbi:hypothetical protein [Micromonospora musae]
MIKGEPVKSGAGLLPGVHPVDPHHVDIAPTIAALLGIQPPSAHRDG